MMAIEKAVKDLNRRGIKWTDIPEDVRKKLNVMEQDIHEADGEGPVVMEWFRMIVKHGGVK
jgi:hypothetical protein